MRITPLDVRKQEFRKAVRGYDTDEVRGFLTTLAEEYEIVLVDNKTLREKNAKQEEKLEGYEQIEGTLRDTLMTAQRVMQDTKDNATREGKLIVQEAQQQAQEILTECRLRTEELRREILFLRKEKDTYLARFKILAQAQIQFVDTHESDFSATDSRLLEMANSVAGRAQPVLQPTDFQPANVPEQPATSKDVWRDYSPQATDDDSTEQVASSLAAAVEMASKGIPVAAVDTVEAVKQSTEEAPTLQEPATEEIVVPV